MPQTVKTTVKLSFPQPDIFSKQKQIVDSLQIDIVIPLVSEVTLLLIPNRHQKIV